MNDIRIIQTKQSVGILNSLSEEVFIDTLQHVLAIPYNNGVYDKEYAKKVVNNCFQNKHLSVFEHLNITLGCVTSIGTYKGYTRHRHCAFTVESTTFTEYKGEHTVILTNPMSLEDQEALTSIYSRYEDSTDRKKGRDFLPQCTAAQMVMTTNIREWRHIISLRRDYRENWLTRELCNMMWKALSDNYPYFFPPPNVPESPRTIYNYWDDKKAEYAVRLHHCKSDKCPQGEGAHMCDKEWHECDKQK